MNNRIDAIYARQSVDKKDSISIESQIEFCKYELKGGNCKEYTDKGYSGKNTDRPKFQELVRDIKRGLIAKVIVYKLDRISRSILDFANMMELFQQYDVEFVSSTEKFDTSTPMGRAMYLALTQGEESHMTRAAVNLWDGEEETEQAAVILENIKKLQHPVFGLKESIDPDIYMYPTLVTPSATLSGKELAKALNFPRKSVNGLPVLETTPFGREVQKYTSVKKNKPTAQIEIGSIYHMRQKEPNPVCLDVNDLASHTFVTGSTGTGKSNTIYQLLAKLKEHGVHYLVVEPAKGEYKKVFGGLCAVYGTNSMKTPLLQINPFSFPSGIHVLEHIDRLIEIFNACWPMYAAMPAILKDAVEKCYERVGWNLRFSKCDPLRFPTFKDLIETLPEVMDSSLYSADTKSDYAGALITRVRSLTNGINGQIFCSGTELTSADLFEQDVIVDLSRVGSSETKALLMGILVMKLQEYRMELDAMNEDLIHITVLEEAHNLLRRTTMTQSQEGANLQGKSVEMITNSIAEMRTYGEGFIIADQSPELLDEAVIRNTNTKIVLRLPNKTDRELVGSSMALTDEQITELAKLPFGVAAVYQNDWIEAVLCLFDEYTGKAPYSAISHAEVSISARCSYNFPLVSRLIYKIFLCSLKYLSLILPYFVRVGGSSFSIVKQG